MIVDDEKPMLEWLSILLEEHGYDVSCYSTGEQAVEAGSISMPDILVVDVKMALNEAQANRKSVIEFRRRCI